jgi:hypothetical protein
MKYNVEFSRCSPGPTNEMHFHIPAPDDAMWSSKKSYIWTPQLCILPNM